MIEEKKILNQQIIYIFLSLIVWFLLNHYLVNITYWISFTLLPFKIESQIGASVYFFLYNTPKVLLLLALVVFVVGIIRSFFTPERTRRLLRGKKEWIGNVMASFLGIVTPFCTCSAVPLFIGFVETGIPLGITFSFLISAPMINELALVMLYLFGWKYAVVYLVAGLSISIFSGIVIGKLHLEKYVEEWVYEIQFKSNGVQEGRLILSDRITYSFGEVKRIVSKVWPYILVGIAIGAAIHGYVPSRLIEGIMGQKTWWAVPMVVLVGVPMYSNSAGILPIVQALIGKGAAMGTVLAFMMAVIGLSLPEILILRRVLKWKLIAIFIGVVATGIIIVGYLFNLIF